MINTPMRLLVMPKSIFRLAFLILTVGAALAFATIPPCVGTLNVCRFRLTVEGADGAPPLPVQYINILDAGQKLKYEPLHIPPGIRDSAKVALIVVAAPTSKEATAMPTEGQDEAAETTARLQAEMREAKQDLHVLEALPAKDIQEWEIPVRSSVVGVVFGPHGLDMKKVSTMVIKNPDVIHQLTEYAEETTKVGALVEALSEYQQQPDPSRDLNAVLAGFGSDYDVYVPKINTTQPANQQAYFIMQSVMPSVQNLDPVTSNSTQLVEQTAGLAGAVGQMFFGTPVGLAAGGAEFLLNLRTMIFPDTDFRSAFTQPFEQTGLALCAKNEPDKPRMRTAYLWMMKVPDSAAPPVALDKPAYMPIGGKSVIEVASARPEDGRLLLRARKWELVADKNHADLPVKVHVASTPHYDTLDVDLSKVKLPAGQYQLAAMWDWQPMEVKGDVDLRPYGDLAKAKVTQESLDHLVAGSGAVRVQLTGTDFEFVDKMTMVKAGDKKTTPAEVNFVLPKGKAQGDQESLDAEVDTSAGAGLYHFVLTQTNGTSSDVSFAIHPPNPTLDGLPLRANLGEPQQTLELRGTRLERITRISTPDATWDLAPVKADARELLERKATVKLAPAAHNGEEMAASVSVQDIDAPVTFAGALDVVGPRPKISSVSLSLSQQPDVHLTEGEIPAGAPISFSLLTRNVDAHPALSLTCANEGYTKAPLVLHPGDRTTSAELDFAGDDGLFLSLDPGVVGLSGCELAATITTDNVGSSDPTVLGRLIRLPRIEKFALTDTQLGANLYSGNLTGMDLQIIDKTGWDAKTGYPVQGIPTPVPGGTPGEQTLKVELPWPPPSPHAPIYVWVRGEPTGRLTDVKN
jgi:hypothetical protein